MLYPYIKSKKKISLMLLLITGTGFLLRLYMAWVDRFLHPWDERFHALVARNMMHHPFKPMLRAFLVTDNFDPNLWCCNHIWVHKQPLFMWQMALSMKAFGVSELAMRLPSVIMGTLAIGLLYRIALLLSNFNKQIALWAAAMLACSNFHLQMISGIHGMDHNDVALGFYVLASLWAYAEYTRKPQLRWVLMIGLFAGCAILCKWLLGLLVFGGWGLNILLSLKKKGCVREVKHFLLSIIACCIVFVPWQLYILHEFPNEARYEYEFNRRHITEALEGHSGTVLYYWDHFPGLFGKYAFYLILIGGAISFFARYLNKKLLVAFAAEVIFVFCFFSFVVKTKVDTYFFFVAPLCLLFSSIALFRFSKWIKNKIVVFLVTCSVLFYTLDPLQIGEYLSAKNTERNDRVYNADIYRNLSKEIPVNIKVVMNMNSFEDIDVMFYNSDITAYHWVLPEADIKEMAQKRIPIAIFEAHGNYKTLDYILQYPYLFIIKKKLKNF